MDILVNRTLYMSCQAGPGIEPGPSALKASALPIELTWQTNVFERKYYYYSVYKILIFIILFALFLMKPIFSIVKTYFAIRITLHISKLM